MKNKILLLLPIFLIILVYLIVNKDSFKTIKQENQESDFNNFRPHVYTNQVIPAIHNNEMVTELKNQM